MKTHFVTGLRLTAITLVMFGFIYPLVITGIAKLTPSSGDGKKLEIDGKVIGFEIIGQQFTSDKYFSGRPSAVSYNAAATGGSNKGPTNPDYLKTVEERISEFEKHNPGVSRTSVPVDLVTASGGGLDPHISIAAASIQVSRISRATGLSKEFLGQVIEENTKFELFGLAPATVNVLKMNIAIETGLKKNK